LSRSAHGSCTEAGFPYTDEGTAQGLPLSQVVCRRAKGRAMITEYEKDVILRYAEKYGVGLVLLFGSSIEPGTVAHDVDLGVKGIDPKLFFKFYAELVKHLSKPVDLLDFSTSSGVIPDELSDQLYEYLTFRHFFVHAYGVMLEEVPLEHLARDIPSVWRESASAIERYCRDLGGTA
jgi:hypothetical protein